MGAVKIAIFPAQRVFYRSVRDRILSVPLSWESGMNDLLVVGMTIVIFAVFFLLVKAVERIER
jgi:hypothetical protein